MAPLPPEPAPAPHTRLELEAVVSEATARAARLRASGGWSEGDDADLASRFEIAAQQALRVPSIAERSTTLRGVARRYVPGFAKPLLRRVFFAGDRLLRAGFEQIERRVDRGRTI